MVTTACVYNARWGSGVTWQQHEGDSGRGYELLSCRTSSGLLKNRPLSSVSPCALQAHVVGHDWGAALAWFLAMKALTRVDKLVVLSVGHAGGLVTC